MHPQLDLPIDAPVSLAALWKSLLRLAEARLGREAVRTWLAPARPVAYQDDTLTLAAASGTARDWIEKKYTRPLAAALAELAGGPGDPARVVVVVGSDERGQGSGVRGGRPSGQRSDRTDRTDRTDRSDLNRCPEGRPPRTLTASLNPPAKPPSPFAPTPFNDRYTFDRFVVGESNRFAQAAALAVTQQPGRAYNPLFLYGETGLGKTHLLQAIGQELQRRNPRARVAYVSAETFTAHFVRSLRERQEEAFKRAYRGVDVWLVDDVQFVADKTSTREEFFHTFNELYLTNRQVVFAADRPPQELRVMEERLRSRLASGLMAEIAGPELETRMAILEQRAAAEGAALPPEVVLTIAGMVESNIRALEAALIRVLALASFNRAPLTAELAAQSLEAFVKGGRLAGVSLQAVQRAVGEEFGVNDQALAAGRDQQSTRARRVAMYLLRQLTRYSLSEIGDLFGGKTHSTVVYACQKLEQEMKDDRDLAAAVKSLCGRLKQG